MSGFMVSRSCPCFHILPRINIIWTYKLKYGQIGLYSVKNHVQKPDSCYEAGEIVNVNKKRKKGRKEKK